jgi:hypothetical protein
MEDGRVLEGSMAEESILDSTALPSRGTFPRVRSKMSYAKEKCLCISRSMHISAAMP